MRTRSTYTVGKFWTLSKTRSFPQSRNSTLTCSKTISLKLLTFWLSLMPKRKSDRSRSSKIVWLVGNPWSGTLLPSDNTSRSIIVFDLVLSMHKDSPFMISWGLSEESSISLLASERVSRIFQWKSRRRNKKYLIVSRMKWRSERKWRNKCLGSS